ncbi:UPF0187-domain-containing protein, partial [Periconia macrospinosa]
GPRELDRHSKWPMMLRIHGSVLPRLVLPLLVIGTWTTTVCLFSRHVHDLSIKSTLLVVLGFVVGLSLSLRSTTAYERYMEGRRAWTTLMTTSHHLARNIWVNAKEREGHKKEDLLAKITALNLIVAYARALKHRVRFEPYTHYHDLHGLVQHLDTFAKDATEREPNRDAPHAKSNRKSWGEYLGVTFAMSNPRKIVKRAGYPLGNLPLEILNCLTVYLHDLFETEAFKGPVFTTSALNSILTLNDVLGTTERILNTPLPLAYSIAISQLTWVYILILPFQLYDTLGLVAIPGTLLAAYIILGFAYVGQEIENPFGHDVNDLPLDSFCDQLTADIDIIAASAPRTSSVFVTDPRNCVLQPMNWEGYEAWREGGEGTEEIREALRRRAWGSMRVERRGMGKVREGKMRGWGLRKGEV